MVITRIIDGKTHNFTLTFHETQAIYLEYQHQLDREDIECLYEGVFNDEQLDEIARFKRSLQDEDEAAEPLAWNEAVNYAIDELGYRTEVETAEVRNG